jgi:hypothetical protein
MHAIRASARFTRAIHSTAELLTKLRIDSIFVGSVARAAWLGDPIERGSIDVLALMSHQQKNQLAMMASNRGYRVEREEIEQSEELDLVPLNFVDEEGDVRVHVLLASNALYGKMVTAGVEAESCELPAASYRVPSAEDFALLLMMSDDEAGVQRMKELPEFDRAAFVDRLVAIGLGAQVVRS